MAEDDPLVLGGGEHLTLVQSLEQAERRFVLRRRIKGDESGALGETNLLVIAAGVVGLGLALYGVWVFFGPAQREEDAVLDDVEIDPDALLDEIVALDVAFEAGEIGEKEYQARRAELKELLREAME